MGSRPGRRGLLRVAAASDGIEPSELDGASAIADSFARRTTIVRPGDAVPTYREDRLFARDYICFPFESGVIALASPSPISEPVRSMTEAIVAALSPRVAIWSLQAESSRLRALTHTLGLRLLAVVDNERAQIARDLHDDQAQLLAAAKLALSADKSQAREILSRLEQELRAKVRRLKPATLGKSSLRAALAGEIKRLGDAGIKGHLSFASSVAKIALPIQQVCYQAAREAVSNVIRHARANRVELTVGRRDGVATMVIEDNGRGMGRDEKGSGLAGLEERLHMMGGRLQVDSRKGATRLMIELPEAR